MNSKINIDPKSVTKSVIAMSWPTIVAMLIQTSFNIIDTIFVGKLSADALAGVSLSFPIMFFALALGNGIGVACTSLISRALGKKRFDIMRDTLLTSIWVAIFTGIASTLLTYFFGKPILGIMSSDPNVLNLGWEFLKVYSIALVFITISITINSIFRAQGDMKTPMIIMIIAAITNIALDPLFIFGIGSFPNLGVEGAAVATLIARTLSVIVGVTLILVKEKQIILPIKFVIKKSVLKEIIKVGIPSSLNQMASAISILFLNAFVSFFGSNALAAFAVVFRVESLAYLPAIAISNTAITMVGHTVGKKLIELSKRITTTVSKMNATIMISIGILFYLFSKSIIKVFTTQPKVVSIGSQYFKIVPIEYIFAGILMARIVAFQGAGNAMPSMVLNLLRGLFILIPLAYILSRNTSLGLIGIWIAMIISTIISFLIGEIWYKRKFDYHANKGYYSIDNV